MGACPALLNLATGAAAVTIVGVPVVAIVRSRGRMENESVTAYLLACVRGVCVEGAFEAVLNYAVSRTSVV